jgi:hypothetical protein
LAEAPSQSARPLTHENEQAPVVHAVAAPGTRQQSAAVEQVSPGELQQTKFGASQLTVVEQQDNVPPPIVWQDMPVSAHGAQ